MRLGAADAFSVLAFAATSRICSLSPSLRQTKCAELRYASRAPVTDTEMVEFVEFRGG